MSNDALKHLRKIEDSLEDHEEAIVRIGKKIVELLIRIERELGEDDDQEKEIQKDAEKMAQHTNL